MAELAAACELLVLLAYAAGCATCDKSVRFDHTPQVCHTSVAEHVAHFFLKTFKNRGS